MPVCPTRSTRGLSRACVPAGSIVRASPIGVGSCVSGIVDPSQVASLYVLCNPPACPSPQGQHRERWILPTRCDEAGPVQHKQVTCVPTSIERIDYRALRARAHARTTELVD